MKAYLTRRTNPMDVFDAFDSAFDNFFRPVFSDETSCMKTNIRETDDAFILDVEVPGFTKEQIKISLEKGYLSIVCSRQDQESGKYRRKEICESCTRSYYVGDDVTKDSIKAKHSNGILTLSIPKSQPKPVEASYIDIE